MTEGEEVSINSVLFRSGDSAVIVYSVLVDDKTHIYPKLLRLELQFLICK